MQVNFDLPTFNLEVNYYDGSGTFIQSATLHDQLIAPDVGDLYSIQADGRWLEGIIHRRAWRRYSDGRVLLGVFIRDDGKGE